MKKMKTFLISIFTLVIALTASLMFFGCGKKGETLSFATAYDYSAIAGVGILKTQVYNEGVTPKSAGQTVLDENQKEQIINSIAISQNLTGEDLVKTSVTQSDRDGYEFRYTVKARNYAGEEETYVFYYTQTDVSSPEDVRENEKEYRLNGLVIFDEVEYTMTGEQEVEDGETEYTFKILIDNDNYVVIEQESERNETEFEYTAYKGGRKVFSTAVEYEVDRKGNVEMEYELFDRQNGVSRKYKYEFFERNGGKFAKVIMVDSGNAVLATVKITETPDGFQYDFIEN